MKKIPFIKLLSAIVVGIALAACAGPGTVSDSVGPYPTDWKSIVASYIRNNFVGPHSVIDSEAAPPFRKTTAFFDFGWMVCIRNNAKNQLGGYTGRRITELGIKKGQVVTVDSKNDMFCRNAKFEPFPLSFR